MKHWHYSRIRFYLATPAKLAPAGNWVSFFVSIKNDDPRSPFRETHYACETLGL